MNHAVALNTYQTTLPGIDMRPVCTFCKQPGLLGQYSPLYPHLVCRECSEAEPYPIEVFEYSNRSKDRSGLRIIADAPYEQRERRAWLDDALKQAARGVLDERQVVKLNLTYRDLRNPIRRSKAHQFEAWHKSAMINNRHQTLHLPYCERCGSVHDRRYEFGDQDYMRYCQRCEDELHVETLFRMPGIFGDADDEEILDRLYKAFPGAFERGVLPDYWYKMKLEDIA